MYRCTPAGEGGQDVGDVEVGAHGQDHIPTLDILSRSRLQSKYLRLIILVDVGNTRSEMRKLSV